MDGWVNKPYFPVDVGIMRIVLKPQQCLDHDDEEPPNCNKSTRFNPNYDLSLYNNASLGMDIGISCCV